MSNSLESRSPFVDHEFIEYVLSHKKEYFIKNGISKFMLRKTMSKTLPQKYIDNKKIKRPGREDKVLDFYSDQFIKLLKKYNVSIFYKNKILKNFKSDLHKKDYLKNSIFYFRVLNYLIWKDINFKC